MLETLRVQPHIRARIPSGPLGPNVDGFVAALERERYTAGVIRRYVRTTEVFGRWLRRGRIAVRDIDEAIIAQFVGRLRRTRSRSRPRGLPPPLASGVRIVALLCAARALGPPDSLRPHTMATLIGLLASCGLRAREALRLRLTDVDLDAQPRDMISPRTRIRLRQLATIVLVVCTLAPVFNVLTSEASLRSAIQGVVDAFLSGLLVGGYLLFVRDGRLRPWFRRLGFRADLALNSAIVLALFLVGRAAGLVR